MSRADFLTLERKKVTIYADFLNSFDKNPTTDFLAMLTNEDAVRQAVKNLVLTNVGERFYDSNKGTRVRSSLFELVDDGQLEVVRLTIKEAIERYEPRAENVVVTARDDIEGNQFDIQVQFTVGNIMTPPVNLNIHVQKVR